MKVIQIPDLKQPSDEVKSFGHLILPSLNDAAKMISEILDTAEGVALEHQHQNIYLKKILFKCKIRYTALMLRKFNFKNIKIFVFLIHIVTANALADEIYFPRNSFSEDAQLSSFEQEWYSSPLEAMNESPLSDYPNKYVLRFTLLPSSIVPGPMTFRFFQHETGDYTLIAKRINGELGNGYGKIIDNVKLNISQKDGLALMNKMEKECGFWNLPTKGGQMGLDGSQWIFEIKKSEKYHVVDRWTLSSGCLHDIGISLIDYSNMDIPGLYHLTRHPPHQQKQ